MAVIVGNKQIGNSFILELGGLPAGKAGQFYMVKVPDESKILPRPISIFDINEKKDTISLFIDIAGSGTKQLSVLKEGDNLQVTGPLGNGFPLEEGEAALIGGACGAAPLYFLAKKLRELDPLREIEIYLGFSKQCPSLDFFKEIFSSLGQVQTDVGGFITDKVDFSKNGVYYACGPTPMLRAAAEKSKAANAKTYLSLENRMACGVGACYACSCATIKGNKRVCKDGPVFSAREVIF